MDNSGHNEEREYLTSIAEKCKPVLSSHEHTMLRLKFHLPDQCQACLTEIPAGVRFCRPCAQQKYGAEHEYD